MKQSDFSVEDIEGREYIAKIRKLNSHQLENIKSEVCIFLVSVGKPKFEGNSLISQLKMIKNLFKGCVILAADTLQRFNVLVNYRELEDNSYLAAEKWALAEGDVWIEKYRKQFDTYLCSDFYRISRWNDYIYKSDFKSYAEKVVYKLSNDKNFRLAMDESVDEYVRRGNRQKDILSPLCEKFLIEECTVLLMLASEGYNYLLYPGSQTKILELTQRELIANNYQGKLAWLAMRLDKVKIKKYNEKLEFATA